ncbi:MULTISPECIES: 2Fe-2S iron-sulfur cluster-binding protein [Paraburkholderia]|uniref:2Fe-2S iron-sulfur cluster binding domain-containing protein n=1 Tax=Paraburkholderia podalyriae TaxID=1938811 RepID=A0ABR7Q1N3_9BURK|nr:2Fe-2S iron-sulfur cluster-binding protein [Paraburkholderia podalyriae]MBC8752459.1 2Fe-2S iron-sulfur cluster binding domain-containing protein [Paraburkholderia podalyriae]
MQHVIIIGASIAGVSAAKVLAQHVGRITVVERDTLDSGQPHRMGAPQSQHQHALLGRGRVELDALFPGFSERLLGGGAHLVNPGMDFAFFGPTGWMKRQPGVETLFQSRTLLENSLRTLATEQIANIEILFGQEVIGLLHDANARRVLGVNVRSRDDGSERMIEADLVVDASGRASKSVAWLEALGNGAPEETIVDAHCGYSSRWYAAPSELPAGWWWKAAYSASSLDNPMGGSLAPVEGGRWLVTTWGYERQYPPTDTAGFNELLRHGLRTPLLHEMTSLAEPISPIYAFKGFVNRRRWFSRWEGLPKGYISVGDVGCVFNPVHGQGMTSAVLAARSLEAVIGREGLDHPNLGRLYYRYSEKVQDIASQLSCGYDLRFPSADGKRPRFFAAQNWFFDRFAEAAQKQPDLYIKLMRVMHLLDDPAVLGTLSVTARVLAHAFRPGPGAKDRTSPMPAFDYTQRSIRHPAAESSEPNSTPEWRRARIVRKRKEADGVFSFLLQHEDNEALPAFDPGAHIDIRLGTLTRQYSLCNAPEDDGRFLICAQREVESRGGSRMLCDDLQEGDTISWRGPKQMFPLTDPEASALLLAGGIGMTPLLAMAEKLHAVGTPFALHIFVRNAARLPFRERLATAPYARSVFVHSDDTPSAERIDLSQLIKEATARHLYICGPGGFIDAALATATAQGWPETCVHVERFSAGQPDFRRNRSFTITLAKSRRTLEVPADRSALAVLNEAGCAIPTSCETGVCGTCVTTIVSGDPDHRDSFLDSREQAQGRLFLPCCSRAKTSTLVLNL